MRATPLHLAAFDGDNDAVNRLLVEGAAIDARTRLGETPLIFAATFGHFAVVHSLLKWGADINAAPYEGHTALRNAIREGHTEIVHLLFAKGADPALVPAPGWITDAERKKARQESWNSLGYMLQVVMLLGTERFSSRLFIRFLKKSWGRDLWEKASVVPERPKKKFETELLQLAILGGNWETLELLIERGYLAKSNEEKEMYSLLDFAYRNQTSLECIQLLLEYGVGPNSDEPNRDSLLEKAVSDGNIPLAAALLDAGASTDTGTRRGLLEAAIRRNTLRLNDTPMFDFLLDRGVRLDKNHNLSEAWLAPEVIAKLDTYHDTEWRKPRICDRETLLAKIEEYNKQDLDRFAPPRSVADILRKLTPAERASVCDSSEFSKQSERRRYVYAKYRDVLVAEIDIDKGESETE